MSLVTRLLTAVFISCASVAALAEKISTVHLAGSADSVDWSLDGRWIAVVAKSKTKDTIYLVDTTRGGAKEILFESDKPLFSPVFSPDGKRLAAGIWNYGDQEEQSAVLIWDIRERERLQALNFAPCTDLGVEFTSDVLTLAFSPDGQHLAAGTKLVGQYPISDSHIGGDVCVWNVESAGLLWSNRLTHTDIVYDVRFSPDGRTLASAGYDKVIRLWEPKSGKLLGSLIGAGWYGVSTVGFADGGAVVVTGGSGIEEGGVIRSWDVKSSKQLAVRTASKTNLVGGETCRVSVSPDGKTVYVVGNTRVGESPEWQLQSWSASLEAASQNIILQQPGFARALTVSADGNRLAVALFEGGIVIVELPKSQ